MENILLSTNQSIKLRCQSVGMFFQRYFVFISEKKILPQCLSTQLSLSEELAGTYKVYIKPWGLLYPEQTDTQT